MINEMQKEILQRKKENNVCILAHCYENRDVVEVADYVGDSFQLAKMAQKVDAETVIMCGVRFMAEGVKLLSPEKKVILSHSEAGCPMAEQFTGEDVRRFKEANPDFAVVAYVNTTADIKKESDICVTSASAVKIVEKMEAENILFIPDCNLGSYVKKMVPHKNIVTWNGGCPIHSSITVEEARAAVALHPEAKLLVHPECISAVADMADFIGSTTAIMDYAEKSDAKEFIIGTENSIAEHLKHQCPDKKFYTMSKRFICPDMRLTTLRDVLDCVNGVGGEEIVLDDETMEKAVVCLNRMIELG